METSKTDTQTVLAALGAQLAALDDQDLQREIVGLQGEVGALNRLIQERVAALQLKQFALQRAQENRPTPGGLERSDLDEGIVKAIGQIERAVVGIDDQALHRELQKLQEEVQALNRQMTERQSALNLKHALVQPQIIHTQFMLPNVLTSGLQVSVGPAVIPMPAAVRNRVDPDLKRNAILELLRERPEREWSPAQLKSALVDRGISNPDDGTPVRALLRRMAQDNSIVRVAQGRYALLAPAPAALAPSADSPFATSAGEILKAFMAARSEKGRDEASNKS